MSRMTLSDRIAIEAGIFGRKPIASIAASIGKSPRHVADEIRRNSTPVVAHKPLGKSCRRAGGCKRTGVCGDIDCHRRCLSCREVDCQTLCSQFCDAPCRKLQKPPYVCNVCTERRKCKLDRAYYIAQQADAAAKRRYSEARSKPHVRGKDMDALDALVSPLIKKGQPITHIFAEHEAELPVSQRTIYNYIDDGLLSVGNIDLRRKVIYRRRRKKKGTPPEIPPTGHRIDSTYSDFLKYMKQHPNTPYVEMDTVRGTREKGKRLLTMLFVEQNFMLMFLLRDGKNETVVEQLDWLTDALGLETFQILFPVILTDNGSEFKNKHALEFTAEGQRRTRVFYCDPQASWQKPHVEKNHEFIRYVLPRGKTLNPYTAEDILLLTNHINSTRRSKLDGKTPFELADSDAFERLKDALGLCKIPADEINLTPKLLKPR